MVAQTWGEAFEEISSPFDPINARLRTACAFRALREAYEENAHNREMDKLDALIADLNAIAGEI